jgi:hypothetical protein
MIHKIVVTALLAGTFTFVDQAVTAPIASATAYGSDDTTFNAGVASSSPGANVVDIAQDSIGNTYAAYATFVKKYDPAGNIVWTSPTSSNTIRAIAVTSSGVVYAATAQGFRILSAAGTAWDATNWPKDQNNNSNNQAVSNV